MTATGTISRENEKQIVAIRLSVGTRGDRRYLQLPPRLLRIHRPGARLTSHRMPHRGVGYLRPWAWMRIEENLHPRHQTRISELFERQLLASVREHQITRQGRLYLPDWFSWKTAAVESSLVIDCEEALLVWSEERLDDVLEGGFLHEDAGRWLGIDLHAANAAAIARSLRHIERSENAMYVYRQVASPTPDVRILSSEPEPLGLEYVHGPDGSWLVLDGYHTIGSRVRYGCWETGLACERWTGGQWVREDDDPGLALLSFADKEITGRLAQAENPLAVPGVGEPARRRYAVEAYCSRIPSRVRDAVQPIIWRQFPLLRLLRSQPRALELLESNPALLLLWVDTALSRGDTMDELARCVSCARRVLLREALGAGSESIVRVLAKIRLSTWSQPTLRTVSSLAQSASAMKRLRHRRDIPPAFIENCRLDAELFRFPVVDALIDRARRYAGGEQVRALTIRTGVLISNILRDGARLGAPELERRIARCRTVRDLERLSERLREREELIDDTVRMSAVLPGRAVLDPAWLASRGIHRLRELHREYTIEANQTSRNDYVASLRDECPRDRFPPPPLPGSDSIVPLATPGELHDESVLMDNCVASYAGLIVRGERYIYRVTAPQRATLELIMRGSTPTIGQVRLRHNRVPGSETMAAVHEWFRNARAHAPEAG